MDSEPDIDDLQSSYTLKKVISKEWHGPVFNKDVLLKLKQLMESKDYEIVNSKNEVCEAIANLAKNISIFCFGRSVLLAYRSSETGLPFTLDQVASEIIPIIKPMSRRPGDEGMTFTSFMDSCILLV